MAVTSSIKISAKSQQILELDLGSAGYSPEEVLTYSLADGTGANQVNQVFADQRTLGATTSEEIDLSGGLTDVYGNSIVFTKIKAIIVSAASANGGNIEVGGSATNGFDTWVGATGDYVVVPPGGALAVIAPNATGFAVTAATGDLLKINNTDSASGTYNITLIGVQ